MSRIALMTFSDGRRPVYDRQLALCQQAETELEKALAARGHEVARSGSVIGSPETAVAEARRLAAGAPALAIFNYPVWAFPHLTVLAAQEFRCPRLLLCEVEAKEPGMVGFLAAAGALEQTGTPCVRAYGDLGSGETLDMIEVQIRAAEALASLRGATFGRIGGRPLGMYTARADADQWLTLFGVDVEEVDQLELVDRAGRQSESEVRRHRDWLTSHVGKVHYDDQRLTPALLDRQVRLYLAMRTIVADYGLSFSGIKGQPELTDHYATTDIAEALLNDPYDADGPKPIHVCATEADMDGALTMKLLNAISGTPALLADLRRYDPKLGIWDLCNSGQHPTWFAARADDPGENLRHVQLYPAAFYFPAGGASVHHIAASGKFTFARLSRQRGSYRMQVIGGSFETFDQETNSRLIEATTPEWPHAFARFECTPEEILSRYGANHIHAVAGDFIAELRLLCRHLGIRFDGFGGLGDVDEHP
jgi:L-fucose isomerase